MSNEQPNNPLHGVTLKAIVEDLVERRGWDDLARRFPKFRCFTHEPSVKSTLSFLRKQAWARDKVEALWVADQRKREKNRLRNQRRKEQRAFAAEQAHKADNADADAD